MGLSTSSKLTLAALKEFEADLLRDLRQKASSGETIRARAFRRSRGGTLLAIALHLGVSEDEAVERLRQLEKEGGIECLQITGDPLRVSYQDAENTRKLGDYRSRLQEAGYVNVSVWLTREQAELVRYWHRINVKRKKDASVVRQNWLKAHEDELAEARGFVKEEPPLPEVETDGQEVFKF